MKTLQSRDNLIWIDLEMTGLDPNNEKIIEIATLITDSDLNIIAEGPNLIISQSNELLDSMDEWNQKQHGSSGLTEQVKKSDITEQIAEIETLEFISKYVGEKVSPMCGKLCLTIEGFYQNICRGLKHILTTDILMFLLSKKLLLDG